MIELNTLKLFFDIRNIKLILKSHNDLKKDKNYKFKNLIKALLLLKTEKINIHKNKYIATSFLPPFPSKSFDQFMKWIPWKNSSFYEHSNAIRTAPISMYVSITDKCDYNCWHCSKANRSWQYDMNTEQLIKLMNELQDMWVSIIWLTWWEPLMRDDVSEIIKNIDERSVSYLFTTWFWLTEYRAKELKEAWLFWVWISLDSPNAKVYDWLRWYEWAHDIAIKAIENCLNEWIYTMVQVVVTKKKLENNEIWDMIDYWKKIWVHEIRFLENLPSWKLLSVDDKVILSQDESNKLIEIHIKANKLKWYPKVTMFAHIESQDMFWCWAWTQHSYIDATGNLYPCDFVPLNFWNVDNLLYI